MSDKALHSSQLHPHGRGCDCDVRQVTVMVPIWQMRKGKDRQPITTSKQDGLDSESADFPNAPFNPSMASVPENFCQIEMRKRILGSNSKLQCLSRKPSGLETKKTIAGWKSTAEWENNCNEATGGPAWWKVITWVVMYISTSRNVSYCISPPPAVWYRSFIPSFFFFFSPLPSNWLGAKAISSWYFPIKNFSQVTCCI